MRQALKLHPDFSCKAVTGIDVNVARSARGHLALRYVVTGAIRDLSLPRPTAPRRADGLWQHTCLEVFVRRPRCEPYLEFNFAPSTQWAAYRFDRYRKDMRPAADAGEPLIAAQATAGTYELQVTLSLDRVAELGQDEPWLLGLSAVIEETGGAKSYWALAHPPGKPDFHHSDGFALELPAV